jgi:AcrR family transcriptional regulator
MPPPRARLSPVAIVDIALDVIDRHGLAGLTLTAVAEQAGVAIPSLYKHVRNLAELHQLVTLRVLEELTGRVTAVALGRAGDDAIRALLHACRAYATEHPHRYAATVPAPAPDSRQSAAADGLVEVFLSVLRGYHLDGPNAIHAARVLRSACHGFVSLQTAGGFGRPESLDASYDLLIDVIVGGLPLAGRIPLSRKSAAVER